MYFVNTTHGGNIGTFTPHSQTKEITMNKYQRPQQSKGLKIANSMLLLAALFLAYVIINALLGQADDWAMKQCEKTQSTETCLHTLYR